MKKNGIHFVREPKEADYGTVAVFEDLYGNLWIWYSFKRDIRCVNVCNVNRQYCSCTYTRGCIFLLYAVFADEIGYR